MTESRQLRFEDLTVGYSDRVDFTVGAEDMAAFARATGDDSLMHTDREFAHAQGFDDVIVYGALMCAQLSRLLGSRLPGQLGMSNSWQINYHAPLYPGEPATLTGEVAHLSEATRTAKIKFTVEAGGRRIASGSVQTSVLVPTTGE